MERQMTAYRPSLTLAPRISLRRLRLVGVAVGAAVLVAALTLTAGSAGDVDGSTSSAQLRWQAVAASFDGAPPAALFAQSARWDAVAAAHTGLPAARAAEAARWAGLAGADSGLTPGQAAYAARLSGSAANDTP